MKPKIILFIIILSIFPFLFWIMYKKRLLSRMEYDCLTPEEVDALKRYQAITDIVFPSGEWENDYSWVQ